MIKFLKWLTGLFIKKTPIVDKVMPTTPETTPETPKETPKIDPGEVLYKTAKSLIGKNLAVGNELLGCAISMSAVHNIAFPDLPPLRFVNTTEWYKWMLSRPDLWKPLDEVEPCCVIVSVTGLIPKGSPLQHGHIGAVGKYSSQDGTNYVMSNDGEKGFWNTHLTLKDWNNYWIKYGKVPTFYFKRI